MSNPFHGTGHQGTGVSLLLRVVRHLPHYVLLYGDKFAEESWSQWPEQLLHEGVVMTKPASRLLQNKLNKERVRHGLKNKVSGTLGSQRGWERSRDVGFP